MRLRLITTLAAVLSVGGCATAASTGEGSGSRFVITAEELAVVSETEDITVYQAIENLRPQWLQPFRSVGSGERAMAQAWLDERHLGSLEEFRRYRVSTATEIRYMPGTETATRYGAATGVIMVYTRPRS